MARALHSDTSIALAPLVPLPAKPMAPAAAKHARPMWRCWLWELVVLCLGIIFFIPLVILFAAVRTANPDTQLLAPDVTISAVVSILGNIIAACFGFVIASCMAQLKWLLFKSRPRTLVQLHYLDQASHGILGSLKLLFWHPIFSPLVILSASVFCLKGLIGPFLQQVVHQGVISSNLTNAEYTIPISNYFTTLPGTVQDTAHPVIDQQMKSAALQGIFQDEIQPFNTTPSIPSNPGNATWASNWTLAVCSECQDLSSQLNATSYNRTGTPTYWVLKLPNGHYLDTGPPNEDINGLPADTGGYFYEFTSTANRPSVAFGGQNNVLADFTTIYMPLNASQASEAKSSECILQLCAQQASWSFIDGTFAQVDIGNAIPFEDPDQDQGPVTVNDDPWILANGTRFGTLMDTKAMNLTDSRNQTVVLRFDVEPAIDLARYLAQSFFSGTVLVQETRAYTEDDQPLPPTKPMIYNNTNDMINAIYDAASTSAPGALNVTGLASNIAASLSAQLRTRQGSSTTLPASSTWQQTAYLNVRWAWLTFPVAVAVLTIIVFVWTWIRTAHYGEGTWKDSILSTMFYGLGDELRAMPPKGLSPDELEEFAKLSRCYCADDGVLRLADGGSAGLGGSNGYHRVEVAEGHYHEETGRSSEHGMDL